MGSKGSSIVGKKSTIDYVKAAKAASRFVPSLKKYRNRKTLNRWEKAAISRAANNVAKASRGRALAPLTKAQAKKVNKNFIVGHGIRAIPVRASELDGGKLRVDKNGNFTIKRTKGGKSRTWHYVYLPPDIDAIIDALDDLQNSLRRNEIANVHVLTAAGIEGLGHTLSKDSELPPIGEVEEMLDTEPDYAEGLAAVIRHFIAFISKYSTLDPSFNDWFLGLAYFVQKI